MKDVFRGFLVLRLIGFLPLLFVVAVILGIRSLARGSDVLGIALLTGAVLCAAAIGSFVAQRARGRRR